KYLHKFKELPKKITAELYDLVIFFAQKHTYFDQIKTNSEGRVVWYASKNNYGEKYYALPIKTRLSNIVAILLSQLDKAQFAALEDNFQPIFNYNFGYRNVHTCLNILKILQYIYLDTNILFVKNNSHLNVFKLLVEIKNWHTPR